MTDEKESRMFVPEPHEGDLKITHSKEDHSDHLYCDRAGCPSLSASGVISELTRTRVALKDMHDIVVALFGAIATKNHLTQIEAQRQTKELLTRAAALLESIFGRVS